MLISDTHNKHKQISVPEGDVLIHCGDATSLGRFKECDAFIKWFASQPHKHKVFIAGNHDWGFDSDTEAFNKFMSRRSFGTIDHEGVTKRLHGLINKYNVTYLNDTSATINGVKFFGSPRSKYFHGWAFNGRPDMDHDWSNIPDDTNVLLTHGPPWGILDFALNDKSHVGDKALLERVYQLKKLKVHAFGHIHECPGKREFDGVTFINASTCNLQYEPLNPIQIFDLV